MRSARLFSPFLLIPCLGLGALLYAPAQAQAQEVEPPRLLTAPTVELPEAAELGSATVELPFLLVIETDGSVSQAELLESRGEILDSAARQAIRRLRFIPAHRGDAPVRARIAFSLRVGGQKGDTRDTRVSEPTKGSSPRPIEVLEQPEIEVVVTGARAPEERAKSVIETQVLTRREIRNTGATTLAGALEAIPGLQLEHTFRGTELWIRGLDPEYSLILLDGQRVPGRTGGAIDLSRYALDSIERVEIVRGPSSALYGSDAIGGVVNIITRETERELEADAEARLATNNGVAGFARIAARPIEAVGLSLNASHQHTDAFRRDPSATSTTGSERDLSTVGGSLSLGRSKRERIRFNADYSQTKLVGVDAAASGAVFDRTQLQEQAQGSVLYTWSGKRLHLQSNAQYSLFREQYLQDQRGSTALDSYEDNREHLGQTSTTVAYRFNDAHRTTVGAELLGQILDSERLSGTGHRVRYSAFAQHQWSIATQTDRTLLSIVPGARLDVDSQFGTQLSPKLALRYDPWESLTLRAGYGRGFRAPSFQELLLRFENPAVGYIVLGNPELTAESSHSLDLSVEYRPARSWFLSLAGFRNDLTNMIATVTSPEVSESGTLFTYGNIDSAWTQGLESTAIWSPSELLALTLGYTLMETRNNALERPLEGRPLHRLLLRAVSTHSPTGITLSARGSLSLERTFFTTAADGSSVQITADPLLQVDLRASKQFTEHFELFVGVNNLADAGDGYAALLPRQIYAGLRGSY